MEILDGYATLRPWMSASVAAHAQDAAQQGGLLGDQQTAMVEAVVIGAALASRLDGAPPSGEASEAIALPLGPSRDSAAGDLGAADQVTWLAQVARAIESPMAAKIITQATSEALSLDTQSSEG